jgi:hypothetical protein
MMSNGCGKIAVLYLAMSYGIRLKTVLGMTIAMANIAIMVLT